MLKILFSLLLVALVGNCEGYYWRSWNGTVPEDAVLAGVDLRGPYYIARAWIPDVGIYIGQVFNGQREIEISYSTGAVPILSSNSIQVLCSRTIGLIWHASNSTITQDLLRETSVKPVLGGKTKEYDLNPVYIGRVITEDGHGYIGSVHTDYYLYYALGNGAGYFSLYYDLLVDENVFGSLN